MDRPKAPAGFLRFKWKHKKNDTGERITLCPECGKNGHTMKGGGFQDNGAQAFYEELAQSGKFNGYDLLCQQYEGVMLKCHWSRYGEGECMNCGVKLWHDLGGHYPSTEGTARRGDEWYYYYKPKGGMSLDDFL